MHAEHADEQRLNKLSGNVIGGAFNVLNTLGSGFLEKVYENALPVELRERGLEVEQQHGLTVTYHGTVVGQYFADLLVNKELLVEIKVARVVDDSSRLQCINYLKGTGFRLCLLLNFARPKLEIKRIAHRL